MTELGILPEEWKVGRFIKVLKEYKDYLRLKYKVKEIGIFGSYVKNKQKKRSDLDILVEFYEPVGLGYFEFKDFLENKLKIKVDLVIKKGIKPRLKDKILKETIYIFIKNDLPKNKETFRKVLENE
ncbi:MAG TPA: nucleotidyltransferase [Methanosarcinales archaeon]|nr:nucleotidyltransferase [Methanosarcinales archaeon]